MERAARGRAQFFGEPVLLAAPHVTPREAARGFPLPPSSPVAAVMARRGARPLHQPLVSASGSGLYNRTWTWLQAGA